MRAGRSDSRKGRFRRTLATISVLFVAATYAQLALVAPASAAPFSGGLSPTLLSGSADFNGDGAVNGMDDSNAFFGDASFIDGKLDCDSWGAPVNAGTAGDGTIDGADNCPLLAYDGTPAGETINVVAGSIQR